MYDTCAHIQNADVGLPYKGLGRVKKTSLLKVVISGHVKTTRLLNILKRGLKWPKICLIPSCVTSTMVYLC